MRLHLLAANALLTTTIATAQSRLQPVGTPPPTQVVQFDIFLPL